MRRKVEGRRAELSQRKAGLSQAKRALLAQKLRRKRGGAAPKDSPSSSSASSSAPSPAAASAQTTVATIPRRPADAPAAPLSFTQERLWFLQKLEPASSAYNLVDAFRLDGKIQVELLERALTAVVKRQQVLRSAFEEGSEASQGPVQRVLPPRPLRLPVVDLRRLGGEAGREEGEALVAREGRRPFDLARGEPLRAFLLRWGPEEQAEEHAGKHGLVFDMHHVVADAWAFYLLIRELTQIYRVLAAGDSPDLPPLAVQYADYAAWQRRELTGETLEREIQWWRGHLEGAPDLLELPADRPRPALRSGRGGTVAATLPGELADGLRRLAQRRQATLFMTLLAGFEALVHRLTGAKDFLLGSPSTFRDRVELESLVGVFVNTLVLRADLAGDPAFGEVVQRVRGEALEAFSHQSLPFEKLVEELRPARDLSHPPLVQVVFVLENTPRSSVQLPGLEIEPLHAAAGTAKFDLTVTVREAPDRLYLAVETNRDLFDDATAEALVGWYRSLLTAAVVDPETPVSRLPLLDEGQRRQMLELDPQRPLDDREPLAATLGESFLRQARRTPEAPALTCGDVTLSYGELAALSGALAQRIAAELKSLSGTDSKRGAAEARVGLCLERGVELVVALLAIVRAGAAYVPLDPSYPARRLRWIVADAGVELVVTDSAAGATLAGRLDGAGVDPDGIEEGAQTEPPPARLLLVDHEEPAENGLASVAGALPAHGESLAYVIYTSGSTGRPKGVLVPHHRVLRLFRATAEDFRFGAGDVWTLFHSSSFDFSVWELWGALLHGGRLVVVPYELSRSPVAFHQLLRSEGVTVLNQTPSAFQSLVRADGEVAEAERRELCLRWVIFGGEALDPEILQPWWQRRREDERPRLVNMYGITETTVHVTHQLLAPNAHRDPGIGRALEDLSLRVLDPRGEPQPAGVPGEICVGGAGVAWGYLGRPALTAARFVPDPWSPTPGGRLYRSGDRARYRRDGSVEYLGRLDQQVKVRGFRIEVGEIEAALTALPWIAAAAVTVRREDPGGPRLAAYLVPAEAGEGEEENLPARSREALRDRLPEHMVPSAWAVLESLPLTINGKVDRRRLPAPDAAAVAPSAPVAPRDELEAAIAGVWAEVLGLPQVGVEDSFFDLGGHSLLLVEVHGRLRQELDAADDLAMLDLFRFPTVASLAAHLAKDSSDSQDDDNDGSAAVAQRYSRAEQRKQSLRRRGRKRPNRRRSGRRGDGERNDP
ncbi:MAG: amino acid adenylation domain-containing protein [Acidobacteriota bacterium]|nr:amino acid adenylation domain-containing protein [Acidobacteriota bacterium]